MTHRPRTSVLERDQKTSEYVPRLPYRSGGVQSLHDIRIPMMAIYQVLRGHVRSLYAPTCRCRRILVHDHYYVSLSLYGRRGTAHTFIGPWGSDGVPYTPSHNLLDLLTTMISLLLQGTVICSVSWLLWKYFRQLVVKSPLDNIPGPPSHSFLYGEHFRACRLR